MTLPGEDALLAATTLVHNEQVPSRIDLADVPPRAAAAQRAIAGTARLAVLRYLLAHPASLRSAICADAGVSLASASVALRELEELGYVTADAAEPRRGRTVRYTAQRDVLTDDLTAFMAWVLR